MTEEPPAARGERLSLLFLDPVGERGWGGVETWLFALGTGLAARGHRVAAAGRPDGPWTKRARDAGWPTCEIAMRRDFGPIQALRLSKFMRAHGVDLVATKLHRGIRTSGFAGRFAGRPRIVAFMGLVETSPRPLHRLTYRLFLDHVVTLTETMRAEIARRGALDPSRVSAIPAGLDVPDAGDQAATRRAVRAELGVPADAPVAVAIGRLHRQKRYDVMLDAFARVVAAVPAARLLIVGTGSLEDEILAGRARRGLDASVALLGFREDFRRLVAASDALFMSSDDEGIPFVVLEAMAAGRPVVGTRVGSMEAAVEHGVTGLLVPRGDAAALADALVSVFASPERAAALGAAARAAFRSRFDLARCVDATERLFLSLRRRRA